MFDRVYLSWAVKYLLLALHTCHFGLSYELATPLEQWIGCAAWAAGVCLMARDDQ
jgi:hypothetical protein